MIDRNMILNMCQTSNDINEYLMSLYNIPVQMNAKNIVEIGAGVSTFALVAAANKIESHVTSIDIGGWDTLNRWPDGASIMKQEPRFTMIEGNSLIVPPIADIDFLFLDSEHGLDLTRKEIQRWLPLVRKKGVIMLHDSGHESSEKQGVKQTLNEFMKSPEGNNYFRIDLLDTKIIGMTILAKI